MSTTLCDACFAEFPQSATGSYLLVSPQGRMTRLCSGACLRVHANRTTLPVMTWRFGAFLGFCGAMLAMSLLHIFGLIQ